MFAGSLLLGTTIIGIAVWLEYGDWLLVERQAATVRGEQTYRARRRRWRLVIHALLAACGALMIAAGWVGPGKFWVAAWTAVAALILCILVLALVDALRTHSQHLQRLAETRADAAKQVSIDR